MGEVSDVYVEKEALSAASCLPRSVQAAEPGSWPWLRGTLSGELVRNWMIQQVEEVRMTGLKEHGEGQHFHLLTAASLLRFPSLVPPGFHLNDG